MGTTLYEGAENREMQEAAAKQQLEQQQLASQGQKAAADRSSIAGGTQLLPGLDADTSGSLTPEGLQGLIASIQGSNNPNLPYASFNQWSGAPSPGTSSAGGSNFFPNEAVPAFGQLSGGSS
jgi:hypothetical protein